MLEQLRELYEGSSPRAGRFRDSLIIFDVATIVYVIGSSFFPESDFQLWINRAIGSLVLLDVGARIAISSSAWREFLRPLTVAELVAALSFLWPMGGGTFLRALRTMRVFSTYSFLERIRRNNLWFRHNEEAIRASANLAIFIFVMTGLVYETQHRAQHGISNYADAMYFTVATLTTTGFGDITLPGLVGRMISIVIMLCGVTLFLRLAQVILRPPKVQFECQACGLLRHDYDAVHCKACGILLHIPDEGAD